MEGNPICSAMDLNGHGTYGLEELIIKKVPTSARRDFKEMPIQHDKHLRSMKEVLSTMDPNAEPNSHIEFKEKTHILCARFLGGAWKTVSLENMKITRIKGGMSNMLFLCRLTENHPTIDNEPDKVLLRVYFNPETESHLVAESVIFTLLSERHLGPKLYGIFSGGRLEEYIPSRPLTCAEIAVPSISNKIARRLAHVHQLEVPIWKEPDYLCDALERWIHQLITIPSAHSTFDLPDIYSDHAPKTLSIKDLEDEIEYLHQQIVKSTSRVAFCHNDLQEGNILLPKASSGNIRLPVSDEGTAANSLSAFNPHDPRLVLIDFEYASYNYRGFDFANHFVEYSINYDIDEPPYYEIHPKDVPSEDRMREFMLSYLKELNPNKSDDELLPRAQAMVEETLPFIPVSHLFWGVWGLLQVEVSPVGFGFAEYGQQKGAVSKRPVEAEPFLEDESRNQPSPDGASPKDEGKIVLLVMMLHGLGILIAWNVFITIAPLYYQKFKLKSEDGSQPYYVTNFMNYVCICSQLPNLIINLISLFSGSGNLVIRIVISLVIVAGSCLFTIFFIYIDTSTWQFGFFVMTMASVVVLNAANGFYQNSIYGLVGSFPYEYINAVVLGNNICGLFVTILFTLTTYFIHDIRLNAAVYFSIAFLSLVICIVSFLYVRTNRYFVHQMNRAKRAAESYGSLGLSDYIGVLKGHWLPLVDVFIVFFVTLMLFPAVLLSIHLYPSTRVYDLFIPENLFTTVFVFLNFNTFTVIGSKIADYIRWPSPKYAWIPIFARLLFIPAFLACNYAPGGQRSWPVHITNEWAVFVLISLMSISHGYYSSISLMYAPHGADANKARVLGKMSAFFLVFGIACGIGCSFLTAYAANL